MTVGLILSGGGARASYQVGVLKAIAEILPQPERSPFQVICGASAGAINASLIACESDRFFDGVKLLDALWADLDSDDVHRIGVRAIVSSLYRLARSLYRGGAINHDSWSLFDNSPLRDLLSRVIRWERLDDRISAHDIDALSINTLGYTSGDNISFFQAARSVRGWWRHRRVGVPVKLELDHLMASTAIPGIYPAVHIHREYFGDGAVRHAAPLSPALHLGAKKLFVIGVSHNPRETPGPRLHTDYSPSLAQMTTHLLNASFIDAIEEDIEGLMRINQIIDLLKPEDVTDLGLSKVDVMCITPSKAIDEVAARHLVCLPRSMRTLFKMLGATQTGGGSLASYLLFERPFIKELTDTGYADAMEMKQEILDFLVGDEDALADATNVNPVQ